LQVVGKLLFIMVLGVAISLFEIPKLLQQKMKGELIAFGFFLIIGMALAMAMSLGLTVPNPTDGIEFVFGPISKLIYPAE
jgi:hypothetical protein